jgi:uncharacterized damage-inducible protein DinB
MNWTELLTSSIEQEYAVTDKLMGQVEDDKLDWKPSSGSNWMTMDQLLRHISDGCGAGMRGFVTGDWGLPEGVDLSNLPPEEMLPPAEKMPKVSGVAEAKGLLAEDKKLALDMVARAGEDDLRGKMSSAPWDPREMPLGARMLQMVQHLTQHRAQLFYYLKLQGKPVNTSDLWGG